MRTGEIYFIHLISYKSVVLFRHISDIKNRNVPEIHSKVNLIPVL